MTPSMGLVTADDLIDDIPLLRVAQEAGTWAVDTVVLQSQRNTEFVFPVAGGDRRFFLVQPWIRPDICRGDGATGSAVCARTQTMPPGVAEFVEISATGDTLWSRRIQLPPMPVEDHEIAAHLKQVASMVSRSSEGDSIASPRVKRRLREALIVPEFWPAIRGFRLMPNGEVWFLRLKGWRLTCVVRSHPACETEAGRSEGLSCPSRSRHEVLPARTSGGIGATRWTFSMLRGCAWCELRGRIVS